MANIVWGVFFSLVMLFIKLTVDYNLWLDEKPINHKKEWLAMVAFSVIPIYFFSAASEAQWYFVSPIAGAMISFFIWFFFDGLFNVLRGFNWWFTGTDDPDDAKTDNFLQSLELWQHKALKIGGLAINILLYILMKIK